MALQTMQSDGGLGDITTLLNLVKDQKTTSSTTSNLTDAGVQAQINNILGSNNGLAAVAGAQHSAGFYNSSVNTQLISDLLTRTAAQVQANKAGTTTTTAKKAPVNNSQALMTLASLALKNSSTLKSLGKSAYAKLTAPSAADVDKALSDPSVAGNSNDVAGFTNLDSQAATGTDLGTSSTATSATDINSALDNVFSNAGFGASDADVASALSTTGSSTTDVAGLTSLDSAAASSDAAAASAGTTDVAGLTALDSEAAAGDTAAAAGATDTAAAGGDSLGTAAGAGWAALAVATAIDANATQNSGDSNAKGFLDYTGDVGTSDVIRGFDSGNITDSVNPIGQGLIKDVGLTDTVNSIGKSTGWIICTELVKQDRMPRKYYVPGLRVFQSYRLDLLDGYYVWARPTVALLKTKPFCLRSRFVSWLFNHRAEYLANRAGVADARNTIIGQVISAAVYGFCWTFGQYLLHTRKAEQGEFV